MKAKDPLQRMSWDLPLPPRALHTKWLSIPSWQWVASECHQCTAIPAEQRPGPCDIALTTMEDSVWVVFGSGLDSKLAFSKKGLQYEHFWLALGIRKMFILRRGPMLCLACEQKCPYDCVVIRLCHRGHNLSFTSRYDCSRYVINMISHGDMDHTDLVNCGNAWELHLMYTFCPWVRISIIPGKLFSIMIKPCSLAGQSWGNLVNGKLACTLYWCY